VSIERQCPLEALADIVACPDNVRLAPNADMCAAH